MSEIKAERVWRDDLRCWTLPRIDVTVMKDEDPFDVLMEIVEDHLGYDVVCDLHRNPDTGRLTFSIIEQ